MKKIFIISLSLLLVITLGIIYINTREYENCMSDEDLSKIVKRDIVVFDEKEELPFEMLEKLAEYKVVMTGEVHYIKEYPAFLSKLAIELNEKHNFNTFLVESPQAFNWIYEDFTMGLIPELFEGTSNKFYSDFFGLHNIRDYNNKKNNKLKVHAIDLNHDKDYFLWSLETMLNYVDSPIIGELLDDCKESTDMTYTSILNKYKAILERDFSNYNNGLSEKWFTRLIEMLDVELYSDTCRSYLEENKSEMTKKRYIEREEYLKKTIDTYLKESDGKVLINMGSAHLQKTPVAIYNFEWTGQYLYEKSPYVKDDVYCIFISYAKGTMKNGKFDWVKVEEDNYLSKVIVQQTGEKAGFISFKDELFSKQKIKLFDSNTIKPSPPKSIYDAIIMLPEATFDERFKKN